MSDQATETTESPNITATIKLAKRHIGGTISGAIYNDVQRRFIDGYMINVSNYDVVNEIRDDKGRPKKMLIRTTSGCHYDVELIETLDDVVSSGDSHG